MVDTDYKPQSLHIALSMDIIIDELSDLNPQARLLEGAVGNRAFEFHSPLVEGQTLACDRVYLVMPDQLDALTPALVRKHPSFICAGQPSEAAFELPCNFVWLPEDVSLADVVVRMTDIFNKYLSWEISVRTALESKASLRTIAELSRSVVHRPIWMWDLHFHTFFQVCDVESVLPDDYILREDDSYWPPRAIARWENNIKQKGSQDLLQRHDPYYLPCLTDGELSYRSLCQNIFIEERCVATVCIDEVGGAFNDADRTRLDILSRFLAAGFVSDQQANVSMATAIEDRILDLLDNRPVSRDALYTDAKIYGWDRDDLYGLILIAPNSHLYSEEYLRNIATHLYMAISDIVFVVHRRTIVLIANVSRSENPLSEIANMVYERLSQQEFSARIGVSSLWKGLGKMVVAHRQASAALAVDPDEPDAGPILFDEHLSHIIVETCAERTDTELLIPYGLRHLQASDAQSGEHLVDVLRCYLDNNCSVTATSRELFMHRNTLMYKIRKIERILGCDLNNADERFALSFSLRLDEIMHAPGGIRKAHGDSKN